MSFEQRWTWELDAQRERLWTYIADTDWVNRNAGLPRIAARYEPLAEGGTRRFASFRRGPMLIEWEERPTVWQAPHFFEVERIYRHGPLARFRTRTSLEEVAPGRTRVVAQVALEAASPWAQPLLPFLAAHGRRGANRAFRRAAALAQREPSPPVPTTDVGPFGPLLQAGIDATGVETLAAFVAGAEDRDLQRMRPYELADRWKVPRRGVLRTFLTATRLGLLNLSWTVLCPACRGPSPGVESLSQLRRGYHCEACNLAFDPVFDRSVEVTFDARPIGRGADAGLFCVASPQRSPHVHAQTVVAAGAGTDFTVELPRGSYQISAAGAGVVPFVASDEEDAHELPATIRPHHEIDVPAGVASGSVHVRIASELGYEAVVRIEDGRWPDTIATAAQVTALQEFRDLFSSEVLAPGLELSIESLAVLFTDIVGSTDMYSRTGDAPAFRIVSDHFEIARSIVASHEGTIVKTIGDAVMAVFTDPLQCLEAALHLDPAVQAIVACGAPLRVRVGFHAGPCIAMRANDRIDYFGTTVNLASRLQSLAEGGQVTLARSVAERPAIAERLRKLPTSIANESLQIKGFAQRIDVVRVSTQA